MFRVHGGRLGFAVGDVVGRGVVAAATMGQLRGRGAAYALILRSPGVILQRMTSLAEDLDGGAMVAVLHRRADRAAVRSQAWIDTGVPLAASEATWIQAALSIRMQPLLTVPPMLRGLLVPWMAIWPMPPPKVL